MKSRITKTLVLIICFVCRGLRLGGCTCRRRVHTVHCKVGRCRFSFMVMGFDVLCTETSLCELSKCGSVVLHRSRTSSCCTTRWSPSSLWAQCTWNATSRYRTISEFAKLRVESILTSQIVASYGTSVRRSYFVPLIKFPLFHITMPP